jgi:2-keto-4-pentenoate hydratase
MKVAAQKQAAAILAELIRDGETIAELPDYCRPITMAEGYRVQDRLVATLDLVMGGWKAGATSPASQAKLGTKGPIAGRIVAGRLFTGDVTLPAMAYRLRGMEAEFAFRLKRDLPARATAYERDEVLAAVGEVLPAVEVADTRFSTGIAAGAPNLVADLGLHGCFVLGAPIARWRTVDLIASGATMTIDNERKGQGTGADVLGDPVASLVWLVNHARRHGGVTAGMVLPTGSMTGLVPAPANGVAVADYGRFGRITVRFQG